MDRQKDSFSVLTAARLASDCRLGQSSPAMYAGWKMYLSISLDSMAKIMARSICFAAGELEDGRGMRC